MSLKNYKHINVYDATQERLKFIFEEFDNIYISFSGGKDSGAVINLVVDFIKKNNFKKKVGLFHQDMEAQYQQITDYVDKVYNDFKDYVIPYWCCNKIKSPNSLSSYCPYWYTWDETQILVRDYPDYDFVITNTKNSIELLNNCSDYHEHYRNFSKYIHNKYNAKKTVCLTGVRTDESLNRFRSINNSIKNYKSQDWIIETDKDIYTAKIIYDWKVSDIWLSHYKFNWSYSEIYDLFYKAGVPINQMRVASPFHEQARDTLHLYRIIAPDMWSKLLLRVNGVNYASIYSNTKAFGRSFSLPKNHTWKSYTKFLLNTLPNNIRKKYIEKFKVSLIFWRKKGGVLTEEEISILDKHNIKYKVLDISKQSKRNLRRVIFLQQEDSLDCIKSWAVPSWKRFAITILKNDITCKTMGFSVTKEEIFKKIKKIETALKWSE